MKNTNMGICRLCLQPGAAIIQNSQEIFEKLKELFPDLNCLNLSNQQFCDTCLKNIQVITNLITCLKLTNKKMTEEREKSALDQIDVLNIIKISNGLVKDFRVCRICLNSVNDPQVFLYKNEYNLLRHDLIFNMFKFCKLVLNCDISDKPVMCLQCWENLQAFYSFKKDFLETDKKVRSYCTLFKISAKDITNQALREMRKYFLENDKELDKDMALVIKEEYFCNNGSTSRYSLRKRNKKEDIDFLPVLNTKQESNEVIIPKRSRHFFTCEEDELLLKTYLKITNNKKCVGSQLWKEIYNECKNNFSMDLGISSISCRIKRILAKNHKNSIHKTPIQNKPNQVINKMIKNNVNIFAPPSNDYASDSDDSFIDEVIPSSFAPIIKPEPLSDNDEIHIIEPKIEPSSDLPPSETETDNESLPIPLLERMDFPPMNFKIQDIYSIDVKRETLNMIDLNRDAGQNVVVDDFKTCKRVILKNQNNETIYKCMQCNFVTKYQYSADRHSQWHANPTKKGFQCERCPFITSKHFLLKHHINTNHEDNVEKNDSDDDLPLLMPFTV